MNSRTSLLVQLLISLALMMPVSGARSAVAVASQMGLSSGVVVSSPALATLILGQHAEGIAGLQVAAETGDAEAMLALSTVHYVGLGTKASFREAARWALQAADTQHPLGLRVYGWMVLNGHGVPKNPRLAAQRFAAAAELGDSWSMYLLARLLEGGASGVEADLPRAISLYEYASSQDFPYAAWRLGELLLAGVGTAKDIAAGVKHLQTAADAGVIPAQRALARQIFKGEGIVQNYNEALARFLDAAKLGDAVAQNGAGFLLLKGLGTKQPDPNSAAQMFMKAAAQGEKDSLFNLGQLFRDGTGVKQNFANAHAFFNLAGAQGVGDAIKERSALEARMNPEQIRAAQRFAQNWRTDWQLGQMQNVSSGSGFFVSIGGALITNHHVVSGCDSVGIRMGDQIRPARVAMAVKETDLALVHLLPEPGRRSHFRVSRIAGERGVALGERVTVFGWPLTGVLSSDGVLTSGTVSAFSGYRGDENLMQISAQIQPGNSGGSVLGESGQVIGVVRSTYTGGEKPRAIPQNVNFAVKHTVLADLLGRHQQRFYRGFNGDGPILRARELAKIAQDISAQVLCYRYKF